MTDLGKSQIDATLYQHLISIGIHDSDARELARLDRAGGADPQAWVKGLNYVAQIALGGSIAPDWGLLPSPWDALGPKIVVNGRRPELAILDAVATLEAEYALALHNAIEIVVKALAQQAAAPVQRAHLDSPASPQAAARAVSLSALLQPPDINLVRVIQKSLQGKRSAPAQRKRAGEFLQTWLLEHGRFVKTAYNQPYYLYLPERKLFTLDSLNWDAWLYRLTGVNPASPDFRYLKADCFQLGEYTTDILAVVRVSHWDKTQQVLRVSRFDGTVYRLDGQTIETEGNGDGPALFQDGFLPQPYEPDFSACGTVLEWSTGNIANWDGNHDHFTILFRNWWLATFFTELCPTRPILLIKGEKGSGKSMAIRMMLRLM